MKSSFLKKIIASGVVFSLTLCIGMGLSKQNVAQSYDWDDYYDDYYENYYGHDYDDFGYDYYDVEIFKGNISVVGTTNYFGRPAVQLDIPKGMRIKDIDVDNEPHDHIDEAIVGNKIVIYGLRNGRTYRNLILKIEDFSGIVNQMNDIAVRVAKLIENIGFMEVEFIVDSSGKVLILEINPRVSGTLRMASMACDSMCFDLLLDETMMKCNKRLECVHNVLEIPCLGKNFSSEEQDIICTTRASFCFNDLDEMVSKIKTVKRMEEKCYINEAKNIVLEKLPQTI